MKFASRFHAEPPPDVEESDVQARLDWVDDVVRAFCQTQTFRDRLVAARKEDTA
jgi:hypothetical protein